jgi:CopG family transcriptional regulator / antitoxin EndoAI
LWCVAYTRIVCIMNTMKIDLLKRINITLPAKTLSQIDKIASYGSRSRFINEAVTFYVQDVGSSNLRSMLKEGAIHRADRDRDIGAEWFNLEGETWKENAQ